MELLLKQLFVYVDVIYRITCQMRMNIIFYFVLVCFLNQHPGKYFTELTITLGLPISERFLIGHIRSQLNTTEYNKRL